MKVLDSEMHKSLKSYRNEHYKEQSNLIKWDFILRLMIIKN